MKDLLREYGKTVAIFAAAGLLLSLLVGLFARNPFGTMVLRAFLLGIAFGGIGAGLQYVVRRFLTGNGGSAAQADAGPSAEKSEGATIDIVLPEEPVPAVEPAEARGQPLEEIPAVGEAAEAETVEELADASAAPRPEAPAGGALDALPDIASVGSGADAPRGTPRFTGARAKPSDATRDILERQDRALLARGVRTMLKRDDRP